VIPRKLKRRIAAWALRQLELELGEWRTCRGTHWQLESVSLSLSMFERSAMELRYVQPAEFIQLQWPEIDAGANDTVPDLFIPGDWRVPGT
jgi:hypothetical protein